MKQGELNQALLAHAAAQTALLQLIATYYAGVAKHDFVISVGERLKDELRDLSPVGAEIYSRFSEDQRAGGNGNESA